MNNKNPIVFISYSHDNKIHLDRVLALSNKLRSEGIDCILDQYEESPPEGWPKWMDKNVRNSDFVLVICTETYYNKVIGNDENGKGIKWESTLIYQQLYNSASNNTKFIPVLFKDGKFEYIPEPLQGATFYDVDNVNDFNKLYWRLRGINNPKPELGKLRELSLKERKTIFISDLINQDEWDKANWKKGIGFLFSENGDFPPLLVLFFESLKHGKELFSGIIQKIGKNDENERLRISIILGEVPEQENGYFVVIGEYGEATDTIFSPKIESGCINYFLINQRINRIYTENESKYLNKFIEEYKKFNCFYIAPGIQVNDDPNYIGVEYDEESVIFKKRLEIREYRDIPSLNDPDSILKTEEIQKHRF